MLAVIVVLIVFLGYQWRSAISRNRFIPDEPFRIAGHLYHGGATGVTSFLITGPQGHVLIDGGYQKPRCSSKPASRCSDSTSMT